MFLPYNFDTCLKSRKDNYYTHIEGGRKKDFLDEKNKCVSLLISSVSLYFLVIMENELINTLNTLCKVDGVKSNINAMFNKPTRFF